MSTRWILRSVVALLAILFMGLSVIFLPVKVAAQRSFYEGKTIRIIAGFSPGGSIDLQARLFARHLPKHIPGSPAIIVQNMTGAGGIIAANYTFGGIAKSDGLSMLHFPSSTVMNVFLLKGRVKYEIRKVTMLWVKADSWVTIINPKASKVNSAKDITTTSVELAAGGSGVTSLRSLRPKLALQLFGVKHRWVTGYRGSAGLAAALDREEVHIIELPLASYGNMIEPREKEGTALILWQTGILKPDGTFQRSSLIPNVPTLDELLPNERKKGPAWKAWKSAVAPQAFQSAVGLPPGVPSDRVRILNKAFEDLAQDEAYQKEFQKVIGQPADASVGDEAAKVVNKGLKQLFEEFQEGIEYLRGLPKKR